MRDFLFRWGPIAWGLLVGWLLFHPPFGLADMGFVGWVLNVFLCGALVVAVIPVVILGNLPSKLEREPVSDAELHPALRELAARIEQLGFRSVGPPSRVKIAPPAILMGFVHPEHAVYASAFRTTTPQAQVGFDFVSILHGDRGGLTTGRDRGGAALPASAGAFRQVLPGSDADGLFRGHLEGMGYLEEQGVQFRSVSAGTFHDDLASALAKQRSDFASSPVRGTLLTLWRSATKQVPFVGRLRDQPVAARQLERYRAGARDGMF